MQEIHYKDMKFNPFNRTQECDGTERFDASVRKELPFAVDSLRWLDGVDMDSTNLQLISSILSEKGESRLDFHL